MGKSRRKGKAFKIERKKHYGDHLTGEGMGDHIGDNSSTASGHSSMEQDVDAKSEGGSSGSGVVISKSGENGSGNIMHLDHEGEQNGDRNSIVKESTDLNDKDLNKNREKSLNGSHICKFCEIAFMDSIMYTIHMGYHGFQDPFKCNMCGIETTDKVSFFMHVATKSHNQ